MHALAGRNSLSSVSVVSCRSTWHVHCSTPSVASSASNASRSLSDGVSTKTENWVEGCGLNASYMHAQLLLHVATRWLVAYLSVIYFARLHSPSDSVL